jgi:cytochrome c oxidase subunit 3
MAKDFNQELSPEVREKMKKNLVYIAIFSVVMIFAGFTSGYIVSMGDSFWVKYNLPTGFWISTTFILISSLIYHFAVKKAQEKNMSSVKVLMPLALLCGIGFSIFQFVGYSELVKNGSYFKAPIFVVDGRYGDYFEIKYKGKYIEVNGNDYLYEGKVMNSGQLDLLKQFVKPFENIATNKNAYHVGVLIPNFELYYQHEKVSVQGGLLVTESGKTLQYTDVRRLQFLAWNIRDNRGDFFHKGTLGKDFHVYYKGKELQYTNRELMLGNKRLSAPLQIKANQSSDTSTSYLYIITVLHLLHIIGTIFYLIKMVVKSFTVQLPITSGTEEEVQLSEYKFSTYALSMKLGAIFWHFLGVLWIYLLMFLIYIH